MAPEPREVQLDDFYAALTTLCDSFLGSVQSLHDVYQVEHNSRILKSLAQLQNTIGKSRESYGIQDHHNCQDRPRNELRREIQSLRSELEKEKLDLENAEKQIKEREEKMKEREDNINEYQDKIAKSNATEHNLRKELASNYEERKEFDLAAQQYHYLSQIKAEERNAWSQKVSLIDGSAQKAQEAESAELNYKFVYGKMLVAKQEYSTAESIFEDILERQKRRFRGRDVQSWQTREVQSELCKVLRLQRTQEGLVRAEYLYNTAGFLGNLNLKNDVDRTWAVRNAFNIASVRAEQGRYDDAIGQAKHVWRYRHYASSECIKEISSWIVWLLETLEQLGEDLHAKSAVKVICEGDGKLSPQLVGPVFALGQHLHIEGKNKQAIKYLQLAWNTSSTERPKKRLSTGWTYSWSLCNVGDSLAAEDVLKRILELSNAQTQPNEFQVKALLAHTQLDARNFMRARQNARAVYDRYKNSTILPSQGYHHADTLIRAMAKEDFYERKWTSAEKIWQSVYKDARKLSLCSDGNDGRIQVKNHAAAGLQLAKEWNLWRKGKGQPASTKANMDQSTGGETHGADSLVFRVCFLSFFLSFVLGPVLDPSAGGAMYCYL